MELGDNNFISKVINVAAKQLKERKKEERKKEEDHQSMHSFFQIAAAFERVKVKRKKERKN